MTRSTLLRDQGPGPSRKCGRDPDEAWRELCREFLPLSTAGSKWRFSRRVRPGDPEQGWKLHISATVLNACEVLRIVGPVLRQRGILFKAPRSLHELVRINCGLYYGHTQVGKFLTVYPPNDAEALFLATKLHDLTAGIQAPVIPFDSPFRTGSPVYYRYGAFRPMEIVNPDATRIPAIRDPCGELVPDTRDSAEPPPWVVDPFARPTHASREEAASPLKTTFRAFKALSQRGKGGVYQAVDLTVRPPRFCVVKEGRQAGETNWDGRDGYWMILNEERVLRALRGAGVDAPMIYSSFEVDGNYYLVTEFIEGHNLQAWLSKRKRRLPLKGALTLAAQISHIICQVHAVGWVWRDCKPANLMLTRNGVLRPVDFEGACPADKFDGLPWGTPPFAAPEWTRTSGNSRSEEDLYALGAVVYFLLSGRTPDAAPAVPLEKLRPGVPPRTSGVVAQLLSEEPRARPSAREAFEILSESLWPHGDHRGILQTAWAASDKPL